MITVRDKETESYRERLYKHYLASHQGGDLEVARAGLHASAPYLRKLIRRHIPRDRDTKIVDLGCGYGALLYWLRHAGYRKLTGVDRSPEQVQGAHSLGLDFVQQGDIMTHLERSPAESFDVVIAFDVIEHLRKDEALHFVDEVFRVLVPGGTFALHTPNGEGIFSATEHGDFTHELTLTPRSAAQLLRCGGFTEISAHEDAPVIHGPISVARYVLWKLFRTGMRVAYAAETGDLGRNLVLTQNFLVVARKKNR